MQKKQMRRPDELRFAGEANRYKNAASRPRRAALLTLQHTVRNVQTGRHTAPGSASRQCASASNGRCQRGAKRVFRGNWARERAASRASVGP